MRSAHGIPSFEAPAEHRLVGRDDHVRKRSSTYGTFEVVLNLVGLR